MAQAGPSNPAKKKKGGKGAEPKVKSKKIKKLSEAKAIADLEQSALQFVSLIVRKTLVLCTH